MVIVNKAVAGLNESMLSRFVARAAREIGLKGQVSVLLTSNREMKSLNTRFRGKNVPTDVLSFPTASELAGRLVGDIAISAEMAAQNARDLGHSPVQEVKILALHGLLHLAGYDHERDRGVMARREQRLRVSLGLPGGLIERSSRAPEWTSVKRGLAVSKRTSKSRLAKEPHGSKLARRQR